MTAAAARIALFLCSCICLAGCGPRPEVQQAKYYVFGTLVDVQVAEADARHASRAFTELQHMFQAMHRDWHPWEPGLLTDVNRAFAGGEPIEAGADIAAMVEASQELERLTGGRFNPAIGALIELWGFHTSEYPVLGPPPTAEAIESLVATRPSTQDIEIRGTVLVDRSRNVRLDFSGLAKGLAVDRACATLRRLGFDGALVNAGGDVRGYGTRGDRPWRVGVRNPLGGVIGSVEIVGDEAVFTSGNYERFRQDEHAERYAHILDPRNGWPAAAVMSATVIASEGMRADAAATALVVAGLEDWDAVAGPLGLDAVLLTDARGRFYATAAMQDRLVLAEGVELRALSAD